MKFFKISSIIFSKYSIQFSIQFFSFFSVIYKEIVFNNLFESVSACFPVAQKTLGNKLLYTLIESRNNLPNPNLIEIGQKLVIPKK